MIKSLNLTLAMILFVQCYSQQIFYSAPESLSFSNNFSLIGEINNNLFVWETKQKEGNASEILLYNSKMELIKKVGANILQSASSNPEMLIDKNNLLVAYQSFTNGKWYYKLSIFNSEGNFLSNKILDSVDNIASDSIDYYYKLSQTPEKKTICLIKIGFDKKRFLLKFDVRFNNQNYNEHNNFIVPLTNKVKYCLIF